MTQQNVLKEIYEAEEAGKQALASLRKAQMMLNSAGNWGLIDMFGGGLFSGMLKHSKINDANRQLEQARYQLQHFQKELEDINVSKEFGVHISDFLVFADFFFDGLIADWMVQSKIGEAKREVSEAIGRLEKVLDDLKSYEKRIGGR